MGCVLYPAGVFGNGVAALPGGAFAASIFLSTDDPKAADKLTAGQPEGGMLIWRPKTGWEDVPAAATISADNGVAASPDGKQLFVAGTGDETVVRLPLDGTAGDRAVIKTGFHTDNLRWGSDGFLYASGARDSRGKPVGLRAQHDAALHQPLFRAEDRSRDASDPGGRPSPRKPKLRRRVDRAQDRRRILVRHASRRQDRDRTRRLAAKQRSRHPGVIPQVRGGVQRRAASTIREALESG